jgi:hypothetical protein
LFNIASGDLVNSRALAFVVCVGAVAAVSCQDKPSEVVDKPGYNVAVRFYGPSMTSSIQGLFTNAATRIGQIVTNDLSKVRVQLTKAQFDSCVVTSANGLDETVDDVLIFASAKTIDGPGKLLGRAFPCYTRLGADDNLTVIGAMELDVADLNAGLASGRSQEVVLHEMLHVLGLGTLWLFIPDTGQAALVRDTGTFSPKFTGIKARQACQGMGGTVTCANFVPVEGLPEEKGTRDSHWDEQTFVSELMTGLLNNGPNPLSILSIRSLEDLGYTVNPATADPYTYPNPNMIAGLHPIRARVAWEEVGRAPLWTITSGGTTRLVRTAR